MKRSINTATQSTELLVNPCLFNSRLATLSEGFLTDFRLIYFIILFLEDHTLHPQHLNIRIIPASYLFSDNKNIL